MKKLVPLMMALVLVLTSGCTPLVLRPQNNQETDLPLKTASFFNDTSHAAQVYRQLSNDFAQSHGITLADNSTLSGDAYTNRIINDFAAGDEPDVLYFPAALAQTMIDNDQLVSVEEIRQMYPHYAADIRPELIGHLADKNGVAWCVPVIGTNQVLYCNTSLFERYNCPLPETWSDLLEVIDIFARNGIVPIAAALPSTADGMLWTDHMILSLGVKEHTVSPKVLEAVPNTWYQGLSKLITLSDMGAFPKENLAAHEDALALFDSYNAAMLLGFSTDANAISNPNAVTVVTFPSYFLPEANKQTIVDIKSGYYISRKAWSNPQLRKSAVDFVLYMTSAPSVMQMVRDGSAYPALLPEAIQADMGSSTLAQDALELVRQTQIRYSMGERLTAVAWSSLARSVYLVVARDSITNNNLTQIPALIKLLVANNQ